MDRIDWRDRIAVSPDIHRGDPCVKGTRIPVSVILGSLAEGMSIEEILEAFPQLSKEDIRAALAYAAEVLKTDTVVPLP